MSPILRLLGLVPLSLVGCASSQYPSIDDPLPPPDPSAVAGSKTAVTQAAAGASVTAPTTLQRADVERVVDAGLGRFLAHIAIEPSLSGGKFTGWIIVGLDQQLSGVDLQPGDVVTRINGMAIERETEAFDAFQAVRQAPMLEVSYLRQNQPRTLRLTIIGAASPSLPKAPSAAPAAPTPAASAAAPSAG